jgi:lysophospholipase L1-like esterase
MWPQTDYVFLPLGAQTSDAFHVVVIGDSVAWGNGLLKENKYYYLVADWLRRVKNRPVEVKVYAHSGATITGQTCGNIHPALSSGCPTLIDQANSVQNTADVDLILVSGGGNDVGIMNILDYYYQPHLITTLSQNIEGDMENLLNSLLIKCPNAEIIVTNYYPLIGNDISFEQKAYLWSYYAIEGQEQPPDLIDRIRQNSDIFHVVSTISLTNAVNHANNGANRISLASTNFAPNNGYSASETWLWEMAFPNINPPYLKTDDEMFECRNLLCNPSDPLDANRINAIGHPNRDGAKEYARAIEAVITGDKPPTGWSSPGGYVTSSPSIAVDIAGKTEAWVKGGDDALWFNIDGNWHGAGGVLTSDPFAVKDYNGKIHVLVRGGDNGAWDYIYDPNTTTGHWNGLGGYITEPLTAAQDPINHGVMRIAAKGGDNALWTCDLDINTETHTWTSQGGVLTSRPYILFDPSGKEHILVRGGDNALWDKKGVWSGSSYTRTWNYLGGYLANGPIATIEPSNTNNVAVFVKGGDNSLWVCDVNSANTPETCGWYCLGGVLTSNPFAIADSAGNKIHTFVRGSDNALWENAFTTNPWSPNGNQWHVLGGSTLYAPAAALTSSYTKAFVIGTDNALWQNFHTTPNSLNVCPNGCTYSTIQAAVNAANPEDIILVAEGTYVENVQIDKSLTINGAGEGKTILDGNQANSVFIIGKNNQNIDVTLAGMTIQNGRAFSGGHGYGGGIYSQGRLTISDSSLSRNSAYYYGGGIGNIAGTVTITGCNINNNIDGGILNYGTGTATITNSEIVGNSATWGAGIANEGTISITSCDIHENIANGENGFGGGIGNGGTATIKDCNIYRNSVTIYGQRGFGGGIGIGSSATTTIEDCKIYGNSAYIGAGIGSHGTVTIERSDVYGNTGSWGGGICIREGTGTVKDNNIYENLIGTDVNGGVGGGIANWGTVDVIGSKIYENTAQQGFLSGAGIYNDGTATVTDSVISENIGNYGGGISNGNEIKLTISGMTQITNNQVTKDARGYGGYGGGIYSDSNFVTFDGPNVAVGYNKAQFPSPSELSWYQGWGVYIGPGIEPTMTNGFTSAQVADNILI